MDKLAGLVLAGLMAFVLVGCESKYEDKLEACYGDPDFVLEMTCDEMNVEFIKRIAASKADQFTRELDKMLDRTEATDVLSRDASTHQARVDGTNIQLHNIEQALDVYKIRFGRYPSTEEGIQELLNKEILEELPKDMWERDFMYVRESSKSYTLKSFGADGKPGGEGFDQDLVLEY